MSDYVQIHDKLKEHLPQLSKTLKRAASYMLERPGDIATLSLRQVAINADVSLPNFGRLAKTLGYSTYGELREVYRKQVQQGDITEYHLRAQNLQQTGDREGSQKIFESFKNAAFASIEQLYSSLDATTVAAIAEAVSTSQTVYITGMQASRSAATYLNYVGGMTNDRFRLIGRGGGIVADDIVDLNENDTLIAIAVHPYAKMTVEVAMIAKERGTNVVGITDSPVSPLAINSNYALICPTKSPMFFESYIGIYAVIEILVGFHTLNQSTAVKRIEKLEAERHRLGEYWDT